VSARRSAGLSAECGSALRGLVMMSDMRFSLKVPP